MDGLQLGPGVPLRVAVIGGGLSGLTAAWELDRISVSTRRSIAITLFEASPHYGGVFGSQRIGNYLIETGADSFITNKPWCLNLIKELDLEEQLISTNDRFRRSMILHRGRPVETPAGLNLLAPAQLWPILTTPLLSLSGKLRALQEVFIPKNPGLRDESLASFVRRRFGHEMLARIAQPMVGGIYTSDPEKLSLLATLPRFLEMEQSHGSVIRALRAQPDKKTTHQTDASGARYSLFLSLKDGMSTLHDALAQPIQQRHQLRLNSRIASLRRSGERQPSVPLKPVDQLNQESLFTWKVTLENGTEELFDAVVLAVPAYTAADLLSPHDSELSRLLHLIEYASTAIVVTAHDLSDAMHPMEAFGLVVPSIEKREILATSFLSRKFAGRAPAGKIVARTFVGGAMQPELLSRNDDELINTVRRELNSIFGLQAEPEIAMVYRWNRSMPQYHLGHLERVHSIESRLATIPQIVMTTNAFHGVGLPEVIKQAREAAKKLLG